MPYSVACVPVGKAVTWLPSQCTIVPCSPAHQTSVEEVPDTHHSVAGPPGVGSSSFQLVPSKCIRSEPGTPGEHVPAGMHPSDSAPPAKKTSLGESPHTDSTTRSRLSK